MKFQFAAAGGALVTDNLPIDGHIMTDPETVVYIVDDDPAARASVAALVQSRGVRTREFVSAEAFLKFIASVDEPSELNGCLVVDVRMNGMSGLDLQQQLIDRRIPLPIIVITGYADVPMAVRAVRAGAVDFLTKPCEPEKLWDTIHQALQRNEAERKMRRRLESIKRRLAMLTEEERAVLAKIMDGLPNKRIARDLDIGLRTVELRRSNLMKKMKADSLAELIQMAVTAGFAASENRTADGPSE